jgi:hypothetical protein
MGDGQMNGYARRIDVLWRRSKLGLHLSAQTPRGLAAWFARRSAELPGGGRKVMQAWLGLRSLLSGAAFLVFAGHPALADSLAESRIARCQELVRREAVGPVELVAATWRVWEDPVPRSAVPAVALGHIRARDLLYDGGIGGRFRTGSSSSAPEVFAFCSYDNLFVWLQGVYGGGVWTQFDPADYVLPY